MYMPEPVHRSISWLITDHNARNREFQELIDIYLSVTAPRLADTSPCYMSIWHSYIPSMAFGPDGSLALLHALVALAALHVTPFQTDQEKGKQRALGHYVIALEHHRNPDSLFAPRLDDAVLATSLVFAHFEVVASSRKC
jgi:Fungal specific transcription factor domain